MSNFNSNFELDKFNKANGRHIRSNNRILKIFCKFIKQPNLLEEVIKKNDEDKIPPAVTFVDLFRSNFEFDITDDDKKDIGALWGYMFLNLNSNSYAKKITKTYGNNTNSIFITASYFEKKILRVFIEEVMFATRPMAYIGKYTEIVNLLIDHCESLNNGKNNIYSNLIDYYVNHFFVEDDTSLDRKVSRFDGSNKEECLNNESSLFLIKKDDEFLTKWFKKEYLKEKLYTAIKEYNEVLKKYSENYLNQFPKDTKLPYYECSDENFRKVINCIKKDFKEIRFKIINYYNKLKIKNNDYSWFNDIGKKESIINNLADAIDLIDESNYRVLVYISKSGLLNISLINSYLEDVEWENDLYDFKKDNKLVKAAIKSSINCENKMHSLSNLFDYLNFNEIFQKDHRIYVFGLPYDKRNNDKIPEKAKQITKDIYEKNNTSKAIYLRLTYNHKDIIYDNLSPTLFFDYFSLLVGNSHSFDKKTLLDYINGEKYTDELKIIDFSASRTTHLYYDDSQFVYSIMDQSSRLVALNQVYNKPTNFNYIQSHNYRLYSLWDFTSICDSLMYGSISILIHSYLMKKVFNDTKFSSKPKILSSQHRLSKINAIINCKFNHSVFNSKGRNFPLFNEVFKKIGLIDIEDKSRNVFDAHWQFANLNNGRLYSRSGFYISIASLCVSILAFAWAGAIFISFEVNPFIGYNWASLFGAFASADKFYFVLLVALVPIIILLIFVLKDFRKLRKINTNLMAFLLNLKFKELKMLSKYNKEKEDLNKPTNRIK